MYKVFDRKCEPYKIEFLERHKQTNRRRNVMSIKSVKEITVYKS